MSNAPPAFSFVLALTVEPYVTAAKTINQWVDGSFSIIGYDHATWWRFCRAECPTLAVMAELLRRLATELRLCLLMGDTVDGLDPGKPHLRRWANSNVSTNALQAADRGWLVIDADGALVPPPLGRAERLVDAAIYVRDNLLPVEFGDVACIVTPTAQTGLVGEHRARLRLWFHLDQCYPLPVLRRWADGAKLAGLPVDPMVIAVGQPIYTARPRFNGMADPVPTALRATIVPGFYGDRVRLLADRFDSRIEDHLLRPHPGAGIAGDAVFAGATGGAGNGVGDDWKEWLDREVGGSMSFFQPLTAGLGRAAHSAASEAEIVAFALELVAERADPARRRHYDAGWVQSTLRRFRAADQCTAFEIARMRDRLFIDWKDMEHAPGL